MKTKADLPLLAGLAHGVNIKLEKAGGLRAALAGNTFLNHCFGDLVATYLMCSFC